MSRVLMMGPGRPKRIAGMVVAALQRDLYCGYGWSVPEISNGVLKGLAYYDQPLKRDARSQGMIPYPGPVRPRAKWGTVKPRLARPQRSKRFK